MNPQDGRQKLNHVYDTLYQLSGQIEDAKYDARTRKSTLNEVKLELKELIKFMEDLEKMI